MISRIILIATLVALLSMALGTVGFSILELEQRSANIQVAAEDPNGLLSLSPGSSSVVQTNTNGVLEIDLGKQLNSGNGMNPQARLEIGNATSGPSEAFSATNAYSQDVELTLDVTNVQEPTDGSGNAEGSILLYVDGSKYNITDGDTPSTVTLTPGGTASYSMHFKTNDISSPAEEFQADLNFQVTEA